MSDWTHDFHDFSRNVSEIDGDHDEFDLLLLISNLLHTILVPRAAILLASASDRELWPVPIRSRH